MAHGDLEPLTRAAAARGRGVTPAPADLRACEAQRWKGKDLLCWNGKRPDRPGCNWAGSQNIPTIAMAGLARWDFHAALARLWEEEGLFGLENGSPGEFYYRAVLGCMRTAWRELAAAGKTEDAGQVRRAIRSAIAWDTMTGLLVPRLADEIHYSDRVVTAKNPKGKKARALTVAVAGMRWSEKAQSRGALTSEDAHSEFLSDALDGEMRDVLSPEERIAVVNGLSGDVGAAQIVCGWMFRTIHAPGKTWRWRLRRTTEGAESVFLGERPNPMKPMRVVTQVGVDGRWVGMRPSPEKSPNKWAEGFRVSVDDAGVIHASCAAGQASLPQLGGAVIWQVDVDGPVVAFSAPGVERVR